MGRKSRLKRRYFLLLDSYFSTDAGIAGEIGHRVCKKDFKEFPVVISLDEKNTNCKWHGRVPLFNDEVKEFPRGFQPTPEIRKYFRKLRGSY